MAITPVGGSNSTSGIVSSTTVTYAPTPGNTVVFQIATSGLSPSASVQDNLGNTAIAGPMIANGVVTVQYSFYFQNSPTGVTGYTVSWGHAAHTNIQLEEYSGNTGVNASLPGNTASGTSALATISVTIDDANDFVVCFLTSSAVDPLTGTVGNVRQTETGTYSTLLMDNTASTAGASVTCSASLTSSPWLALAIELQITPVPVPPSIVAVSEPDFQWLGGDEY